MKQERKISKSSSWTKAVVKKWLNIQSGADEFHSDYTINGGMNRVERRRKSCSDESGRAVVPEELSDIWLIESSDGIRRTRFEEEESSATEELRMFVGTWNVGGKTPHDGLNLMEWIKSPPPADIYVLGFQEIVPLNAGNVLGAEDSGPATKWLSLIRQALNTKSDPEISPNYTHTPNSHQKTSESPLLHELQHQTGLKPRPSFSDLLSIENELKNEDSGRFFSTNSDSSTSDEGSEQSKFCLAASKQMVGLFLCVWVRSDLYQHISSLKVSCVGRGIMGYLGNKGSVSISMTLHQTTFCFVCTHLASGEKEGDEFKRNSDVIEILKRTRFYNSSSIRGKLVPPDNILDHDKIIWLGDLNYRLASTCEDTIFKLLKTNDWQPLLEKDQLRIEQKAGRIFQGWNEGRICFAPTYKYLANSDNYAVQTSASKDKRRTPAWCDRILWKGEGVKQNCYVRGESKFSDHRPVYSVFSSQLNLNNNKNRNPISTCVPNREAEQLFLPFRTQSCIQCAPRRFSAAA
nr:type I inositol polyphosphate 5-phosphatase 8-like isoform X1 [Ipomoea batatas]